MTILMELLARWKSIILITVFIRSCLFLLSLIANQSNFTKTISSWAVWDGAWYLDIAQNWYRQSGDKSVSIVFYPLYPILIKIIYFFTNNLLLSGLLLSFLFLLVASILLYEITLLEFDKKVAIKAVWFMNIFPTSYFFQAIYTESLFLSVSLFCFFLLRKGKLFAAGLVGILATLTRINGLFLLPIFFIENQSKNIYKKVFSSLLASSGFFAYLSINFFTFGNFFEFSEILKNYWFKHIDWPWKDILSAINLLSFYEGDYLLAYSLELPTILLLFAVGIFAFLKIRKSYGIYMLINTLLFISTSFILSTPRYALLLFPIYIALAMIKNKIITVILSISFISLLCYFSYIFTENRWAF